MALCWNFWLARRTMREPRAAAAAPSTAPAESEPKTLAWEDAAGWLGAEPRNSAGASHARGAAPGATKAGAARSATPAVAESAKVDTRAGIVRQGVCGSEEMKP
mmetsp:Transcript_78130/g.201192  ORF Transcript_78130/g.201192 Transcript_78130/m.201192 type:complete len:104 (-) Transcript_78130:58-369(-)